MSLADSLEIAAEALPADADSIRPANGDPSQLLSMLDGAGAVRVMTWLLSHRADAAEEVALDWIEDERGSAPLLEISETGLPKPGRKVLRRVLHRLRSRGIEAPAHTQESVRVARLPRVDESLEAGYVTGLDPRGSRLVFLIESNPSGGARLFEALLDDTRGLLDFQIYNAGRSKVRAFVKQATRTDGPQAVEASPDAVRVLIARTAAKHPADRSLPRSFSEWSKHLAPTSDSALSPGEEIASKRSNETTADERSRAAEMVRAGELGPWPPHNDVLKQLAELVSAEGEGKLVVSEKTRGERLDGALEEGTKILCADGYALMTATRFEESAYVFAKAGREPDAQACLAAAGDLRAESPEQTAVARALVESLVAPLLESLSKESGEEAPADSPLVKS